MPGSSYPKFAVQCQQQDEARNAKILDLYLACYTQEEIAKEVGLDRSVISRILSNVQNAKNGEIHIESLQAFNIWNFASPDPAYGIKDFPGPAHKLPVSKEDA